MGSPLDHCYLHFIPLSTTTLTAMSGTLNDNMVRFYCTPYPQKSQLKFAINKLYILFLDKNVKVVSLKSFTFFLPRKVHGLQICVINTRHQFDFYCLC